MKSIELTEEHKSKLLEMCKTLFPEDIFSFDNDDGEDGIIDRNFAGDNIPHEKKLSWYNEGSHFHWFEFCMTYLMYKLSYEFSKIPNAKGKPIHIELWELNKGDYFKKHPVDYLYEEFKKLKL